MYLASMYQESDMNLVKILVDTTLSDLSKLLNVSMYQESACLIFIGSLKKEKNTVT